MFVIDLSKLGTKEFDYLIGIIFTATYDTKEAYKIPYDTVKKYAKNIKQVHTHRLALSGALLDDPYVVDITDKFIS